MGSDGQIFILPVWLWIISSIYLKKVEMPHFLHSFHEGEIWTIVNWKICCLSHNMGKYPVFSLYSSRKMRGVDIVSSVLGLSLFLKQNIAWITKSDHIIVGEFRVEPKACDIIKFSLHLYANWCVCYLCGTILMLIIK